MATKPDAERIGRSSELFEERPRPRILIVDDEPVLVHALCESLREHGYATTGCASGEQALQELQAAPFDLLLTDLLMPGMDGVDLLAAALASDPQLVGILMTGRSTLGTTVRALQAGALDCILKPVRTSTLLPVLARGLALRRLRLENRELRDKVAVHDLNQALARTLDPGALLDEIADATMAQFEADEVSVMLVTDDGRHLQVAAVRGDRRETLLGTRVPIDEGIAGWVAGRREPLTLHGEPMDALPAPLHPRPAIQSALCSPMIADDRLLGVININCVRARRVFTPGQIKALGVFTAAAAAGIEAARLNERQRRADARYRDVLRMAADGIVSIDHEQRIVVFNRRAEELFGYGAGEVLGQPLEMLLPAHAAAAHRAHVEAFAALPATALMMAANNPELSGRRKDGTLFPVEVSISKPVDGGETLYTAVVRDITERKRADQAVRDLNASLDRRVADRTRQLEAANRAKSDFLANMSHELRTPLNSIIGFSQILKDGMLGELQLKQRTSVAHILDAGQHLLALINDILDLSKVEAGMQQLETDAVDVRAVLEASTLIVREKALAHQIRLDTQIDPGLSAMLADERKLKQIAYNLLSNAVKFTPKGGSVTLRARRCSRAEVALDPGLPGRLLPLPPGDTDRFLAISVDDSGVSIAAQHLSMLFEPFVQVDGSAARRHGGTGLGLSLVRRLAELHGGTVGVSSSPGAGSRFRVWLPYRAPAQPPQEAAAQAAAPPSRMPLALVIEDDDRMAELIATHLRSEGFEVTRAATAEEGLVRAARRRPQLITLDIFLPAMDGWECLRRLKADPALADTPVVIITVSDDLERGLTLGARRVLHKPFMPDELAAAVAGIVGPRGESAPRVLVVDDNAQALDLVASRLEPEGYAVLRAHGGAEAIEAARSTLPDAVILDLMMPGVNGFEVARALREDRDTAGIPILVLTGKDLSAADFERLNGNVTEILAKASFSRSDLVAEVRRALNVPPAA